MGELGDTLKRAREEQDLTLREVEASTKVRKKYLESLEEENLEAIPGGAYAKGFLRIYAKFLGLNPEKLLEEHQHLFESQQEESMVSPPEENTFTQPKGKKWLPLAFVVGLILLLIIVNITYSRFEEQPVTSPENSSVVEQEEPEASTEPETSVQDSTDSENSESAYISGVEVQLSIVQDECWVRVWEDGEEAFQGILQEGVNKTFNANAEITVTLGNAGAARIVHNGRELERLGEVGEVITRSFNATEE